MAAGAGGLGSDRRQVAGVPGWLHGRVRGNTLGTYRRTAVEVSRLRQYGVFFAVNVAGVVVQLLCIAVSHYGFGLTSQRADTVSGAGVGMMLATVLRFWGTRTLVFRAAVPARRARTVREGRLGSWTG